MNDAKSERSRDIATHCFMSLLSWFRIVLLQDAVYLRKKHPSLKIWLNSVFTSPLFERFSQQLLHEAEHGEAPQYVRVHRAIPDLSFQLRDQYHNIMNSMSDFHHSILTTSRQEHAATMQHMDQCIQPISLFLNNISGAGIMFQTSSRTHVRVDSDSLLPDSISDGSTLTNALSLSESQPLQSLVSSQRPSNLNALLPPVPNHMDSQLVASSIEADSSSTIPQYRLASHVRTVIELWREYSEGVVHQIGMAKGPSIQELNEKYGAKWRQNEVNRKAYSRRRHIWETIIQASRNLNMTPEIIAEKMERWRQNHRYTISRLNGVLTNARKNDVNLHQSGLWGEKDVELLNVI